MRESLGKPGSLRVVPLLDPEKQVGADGIDIHLGCYFLASRPENLDCFRIDSPEGAQAQLPIHVPYGVRIILPASSAILGSTLEYIKLPFDMGAQVLTRSSYGRLFITIATATWVHPGFRGCLTLEIVNSSRGPIELRPGMKLAQLVFWRIDDAAAPERDTIHGKYSGSVRPVFPDLEDDARDLKRFS